MRQIRPLGRAQTNRKPFLGTVAPGHSQSSSRPASPGSQLPLGVVELSRTLVLNTNLEIVSGGVPFASLIRYGRGHHIPALPPLGKAAPPVPCARKRL